MPVQFVIFSESLRGRDDNAEDRVQEV